MGRHWTETEWDQKFYDMYTVLENHAVLMGENPDLKPITQRKLAERLGTTYTTLSDGLRRQGLPTIPKHGLLAALKDYLLDKQLFKAQEAALVFTDTKKADDVDWRDFVDLAETNQAMGIRLKSSQRIANVKIETELPIALMFTSDWHLGDQTADHVTWRKDVEFLLETPRLYMVDLGDDRQNARQFRVLASVLEQVLSPKQQALMIRNLIDELTKGDKLLAKIGGNHDEEWDLKIFGEAMQRYLTEKMKAPRFHNRGLVKLMVGKQLYTLLLFHKSRFKSFLRKTHGSMREYQLSYPADIVAGGHDHEPGMEHHHHYRLAAEAKMGFGGETILIKTGTYQDSDYGWGYYHDGGFPTNYTVVLYPDHKKMIAFADPRDAVTYMQNCPPSE